MQETGRERTRREEYTEATRRALLAAGRDAFASEGYQAAGIEAISRAARVTRGAFYQHFEDIDLLSRMVDAMICEVALLLPGAENPKKLRARGQKIIGSLLGSFRTA